MRKPVVRDDLPFLIDLWKQAGVRITERRSYEWKIAFGVWASQLAAMGFLLSKRANLHLSTSFWWEYLVAGAVLSVLHVLYVFGFVRVRNRSDANVGKSYERIIQEAIGVDVTLPGSPSFNFAILFEVGVTFFLAFIGPLAIR